MAASIKRFFGARRGDTGRGEVRREASQARPGPQRLFKARLAAASCLSWSGPTIG